MQWGLHKAIQRGAMQSPYGIVHACIHKYDICFFLHIDMGVLHKSPTEKGLCKVRT